MPFYDDQNMHHPSGLSNEDQKEGRMPSDYDCLAAQRSHLGGASFSDGSWLNPDNAGGNQSHYGHITTPNDGYAAAGYLSGQTGYSDGSNDGTQMPSLPAVGMTRTSLYFPPNEDPETPHAISSKITPSDSFQSVGTTDHINPIYRRSQYFSEAPSIAPLEGLSSVSGSSESSTTSAYQSTDRPIPARSAFQMFSEAKRGDIMRLTGPNGKEGVVKAVAREWRMLPKEEKQYWEQMSLGDKTRYTREKEIHAANAVPKKVRAKKHPNAPKRPMSAFLMYAQQQRKVLQAENPDMPNSDISRLLGETWRNMSDEEKLPILQREQKERKVYQAKMAKWKNDQKLANSLKTANERRQDSEVTARDDFQDAGAIANLKYVAQPNYDQRESYTPSPNSYGRNGHHMWNGINPNDLPAVHYHANLPSQHARGQNGHVPKLFSYPRPDEEHD